MYGLRLADDVSPSGDAPLARESIGIRCAPRGPHHTLTTVDQIDPTRAKKPGSDRHPGPGIAQRWGARGAAVS